MNFEPTALALYAAYFVLGAVVSLINSIAGGGSTLSLPINRCKRHEPYRTHYRELQQRIQSSASRLSEQAHFLSTAHTHYPRRPSWSVLLGAHRRQDVSGNSRCRHLPCGRHEQPQERCFGQAACNPARKAHPQGRARLFRHRHLRMHRAGRRRIRADFWTHALHRTCAHPD